VEQAADATMGPSLVERAGALAWLREYDAFLTTLFAEADVPGAAVCVTLGDEVVYARGFGWRDREARLPATPRTVFGLASLSKSFTALAALVLEARGVWSLDDPVAAHLPGFGYPGLDAGEVRLWHMLSHTTGVPPLRALDYALRADQHGDPSFVGIARDTARDPDVGDYERLLAYMREGERPALAAPGEVVSYSNECVALVGAAIESATERPFPDVLREEVLAPLGLRSATFDPDAARATGDHATLYTRTRDGVVRAPAWSRAPAYLGTGMLKASVLDLGRYLRFLVAGDGAALGLPAGALSVLTRSRAWAQPGGGYGLGWSVREHRGAILVRHGGSLKGVASSQGFLPELGLGVAVLTNLDGAPALRAWQAAVNLALGDAPERPVYGDGHAPLAAEGDDHEATELLERLAGVYASGEPWGRLELRVEALGDGTEPGPGPVRRLVAYTGEERERSGAVALLGPDLPAGPGAAEFVLVGENGAWDGGRFHLGADGRPYAVQHSLRWYDREERPA